jgi:hypothetical protein
MGKPEPVCPKCGADQRERPRDETTPAPKPKRGGVRPMAPLFDDDEVASADQEAAPAKTVVDEMFDDLETVAASDETDEPKKAPREDR